MTNEEIQAKQEKEKSYLFFKTMTCPVCDATIKWRTIKSGKLRVEGSDMDMRQHYYGVDANKYHVVSCNHCGYTAIERYFGDLIPLHIKAIKENVCSKFTPTEGDTEIITYRQAFERYRKALECATAKGQMAKNSEIAYICVKTGWLLRGEQEELREMGEDAKADALYPMEQRFLQMAYDRFVKARMSESFPMAGMDEPTLDYLVAGLAIGQKDYDPALKLLSSIVTSFSASGRMKDKARELKEFIQQEKEKEKGTG